jgi:hypothetical protein
MQRSRRKMIELLEGEQVVGIDLVSAAPGLVTVAEVEFRDDLPDGTVVSTILRGYLWKGEILRKAVVIAAQHRQLAAPAAMTTPDLAGDDAVIRQSLQQEELEDG